MYKVTFIGEGGVIEDEATRSSEYSDKAAAVQAALQMVNDHAVFAESVATLKAYGAREGGPNDDRQCNCIVATSHGWVVVTA